MVSLCEEAFSLIWGGFGSERRYERTFKTTTNKSVCNQRKTIIYQRNNDIIAINKYEL